MSLLTTDQNKGRSTFFCMVHIITKYALQNDPLKKILRKQNQEHETGFESDLSLLQKLLFQGIIEGVPDEMSAAALVSRIAILIGRLNVWIRFSNTSLNKKFKKKKVPPAVIIFASSQCHLLIDDLKTQLGRKCLLYCNL